ncbi:MAG: MATE family efflux transporter [Lachnospiraceae bacterium]|jgi:putative MATE family efflux protein|nr:MATE family efflux transporter [Lachnospiraceae bacterium]
MTNTTVKDMTSGSPTKLIFGFFIPMVFGLLFQQLYNMVDTIIVGKYLGVEALASVGSTGSINFMIIGFCMGVCNGFAIPVAQEFGGKDFTQLRKFAANGAWLAMVFAGVMTTVVCLLCRRILLWMNTPADIIDGAYAYIFVIFLGIPATYLYNMVSGIIRSLGDSRTPLYFLIISSLLNVVLDLVTIVVLDLVTIVVLDLGVSGAAWATVISQAVSGIACLIFMAKRYEVLRMTKEEAIPNGKIMKTLCRIGIPMGLQYSITAIGSMVLQVAVNGLGSMSVAAMTAASKIGTFFCCPFDALGSTMATYGGQNMGARRLERLGEGLRAAVFMGAVYALLALIVLSRFGDQIARMFLDESQVELLGQVKQYLLTGAFFYIPLVLVNVVRFLIQGMGYTRKAVLAGVCEMAALAGVGFLLVPYFGYTAACFASPCAWIAADFFLIFSYFGIIKKLCLEQERERKMLEKTFCNKEDFVSGS